jgi:hypothetical protein
MTAAPVTRRPHTAFVDHVNLFVICANRFTLYGPAGAGARDGPM